MAVEIATEPSSGPPSTIGPYRLEDYLRLPDEPRCELLDGRFEVTPAPVFRHQKIVAALLVRLHDAVHAAGGEIVTSPVDVVLAPHSVVQPDLVAISKSRSGIVGDRVAGAPDLVIEVLSPPTARRDRGAKLRLYAESGAVELWLVDPATRTFEFLENRDGSFVLRLAPDGVYRSRAFPELTLDLESFWRELPE
jgi:Uma2 family endonuclease